MLSNNVKKVLYNYKNFGMVYGTSFLLTKTLFRKYEYKTRKRAIEILDNNFGYIFENLSKDINKNIFDKNIFVFWGQGFDKLPEIPEECIKKIDELYNDYKIYKITLDNYKEYVKIDNNLIKLFEEGKISIQTFSDILRYNLIFKYGGVWCDATLLFFNKIDFVEKIKNNDYYSLNIDCKEKENLWGKVYDITYTTFFFATKKKSPIMKAIVKAYEEYYKKYDFVIDYFLNDYFMILAMKHEMENKTLDNIEKSEGNTFYMLNELMNHKKIISLNQCKQCPQKLTWKNITMNGIRYK